VADEHRGAIPCAPEVCANHCQLHGPSACPETPDPRFVKPSAVLHGVTVSAPAPHAWPCPFCGDPVVCEHRCKTDGGGAITVTVSADGRGLIAIGVAAKPYGDDI